VCLTHKVGLSAGEVTINSGIISEEILTSARGQSMSYSGDADADCAAPVELRVKIEGQHAAKEGTDGDLADARDSLSE
jgi:hypothetical protein